MQQLLFNTVEDKEFWFRKEGCRYHIVETEAKLSRMCDIIQSCKLLALDIETTGLDLGQAHTIGISLTPEVGLGFYLPIDHYNSKVLSKELIFSYLSPILKNIPIVGHNIKFDHKFILKDLGININCVHDTFVIAKLLEEFDSLALKYLGELIFDFEVLELDSLMKPHNLGKGQGNMLKTEEMYEYACQDTDLTFRLFKYFWEEMGWRPDFIYEVEMGLVYSLSAMESRGVSVDYSYLKELRKEYIGLTEDLGTNIRKHLGVLPSFNIDSNQKIGNVLRAKYPEFKKVFKYTAKSEVMKLDEEHVSKYREKLDNYFKENDREGEYNVFSDFAERKVMVSIVIKYLNSWINLMEKTKTTIIYTNFNALGTDTGRMSSNNPNMQNLAPKIRHAIIPRDGYYFISMDYDQVEYRILAGIAGLDHLLDEINKDSADVHKIAASLLFQIPVEDITKDLRKQAKTLNFGLLYGMGPARLANSVGITIEEAERLTKLYKERFLRGTGWFKRVRKFAKRNGYVLTSYGRKRRIDNLNFVYDPHTSMEERKEIKRLMGAAYRKAINTPIQGTSADVTKIGLNSVHNFIQKEKLDIHPILVIHDEYIFEVNNKYKKEDVIPKLRNCLEFMFKDKVKLTVDNNVSTVSWGAMKE